jgi:hypothetical protein
MSGLSPSRKLSKAPETSFIEGARDELGGAEPARENMPSTASKSSFFTALNLLFVYDKIYSEQIKLEEKPYLNMILWNLM